MTETSKVIHVRNVGQEISEADLLQLLQPFGEVTKIVMLRAKNQSLLQMCDVPSAIRAMEYYSNVQPSIRRRNVYMQFSSHQELTTVDQGSQGRNDQQTGRGLPLGLLVLNVADVYGGILLQSLQGSLVQKEIPSNIGGPPHGLPVPV